jgi:hypothetical protein
MKPQYRIRNWSEFRARKAKATIPPVEALKSGIMATAKPNAITEMRICVGCEKLGAKGGSKKVTIIVVL